MFPKKEWEGCTLKTQMQSFISTGEQHFKLLSSFPNFNQSAQVLNKSRILYVDIRSKKKTVLECNFRFCNIDSVRLRTNKSAWLTHGVK